MVGSMDRVIQTSLDVKCLQKECNWVGCIKDYKVCKLTSSFMIDYLGDKNLTL